MQKPGDGVRLGDDLEDLHAPGALGADRHVDGEDPGKERCPTDTVRCHGRLAEKLGTDQVFSPDRFAKNTLYLAAFDVCASAVSLSAGSEIDLAACDGSDVQQFAFSGDGAIKPVSKADLCMTAGDDTRTGGSSKHQIKKLSLELCSAAKAASQTWHTRQVEG